MRRLLNKLPDRQNHPRAEKNGRCLPARVVRRDLLTIAAGECRFLYGRTECVARRRTDLKAVGHVVAVQVAVPLEAGM